MSNTHPLAQAYMHAVNSKDVSKFRSLFAEDAEVNDAGCSFAGTEAIRKWSDREIFEASVTLELIDASAEENDITIKTIVDGNFDKAGLPDPLVITHRILIRDNKIAKLVCQLG
ncbi:MAG: hypothetical protein AMXMBFR84_43650 [Candidatus Hydrogenedentota bacterium]